MPFMIGDQVEDAAQLKATSPLEQAARVTEPLLLAYGALDVRVPPCHDKKIYAPDGPQQASRMGAVSGRARVVVAIDPYRLLEPRGKISRQGYRQALNRALRWPHSAHCPV